MSWSTRESKWSIMQCWRGMARPAVWPRIISRSSRTSARAENEGFGAPCIAANPLLVARQPMGACGAKPVFTPRFSHRGNIPFLELFARGDIRRHSGQLSRALCVRSVRPCPRSTANRCGRQAASRRLTRRCVDSKDFAELVDEPAGLPRGSRRRRSPRSRRNSASTRSPPISSACSPRNGRKNELRGVIRAFRRLAAEHRGETTAEVVTARPLNDDQIGALKSAAAHPRRPRRQHRRQVDPNILGGIVVKLGSQQIDASIRTKLNRLAQAMKG